MVKERAAGGCEALGLRYLKDPAVGQRFERAHQEIGDAFLKVELRGPRPLYGDRQPQQTAVDAVLEFFQKSVSGRVAVSTLSVDPEALGHDHGAVPQARRR